MSIQFCPLATEWGDVASWVAALGGAVATIYAVFSTRLALRLSAIPIARDLQDRAVKAQLLAWLLNKELSLVTSAATILAETHDATFRANAAKGGDAARQIREAVRNADLPLCKAHIFDLGLLPIEASRRLASVIGLVDIMRGYIERAATASVESDRLDGYSKAAEVAAKVLSQLRAAQPELANAANAKLSQND